MSMVEETLHLGGDVELVLSSVGDEHVQVPFADVAKIQELDGIELADLIDGIGPAADQGIEEVFEADGHAFDPAQGFVRVQLGAPTPAAGIEGGLVPAMAIDPAHVEGGMETDRHLEAVLVLHGKGERGTS